jgi:hypothetical protein
VNSTPAAEAGLAAECEVFSTYLLGAAAPPDVAAAYIRAHRLGVIGGAAGSALDRAALQMARGGPLRARAADAFAAFAARGGLLRRKIVLLVALLESRGDTADRIDTAQPGSVASFFLEAAIRGTLALILAAAAAVVIVPLAAFHLGTGAEPTGVSSRSETP